MKDEYTPQDTGSIRLDILVSLFQFILSNKIQCTASFLKDQQMLLICFMR